MLPCRPAPAPLSLTAPRAAGLGATPEPLLPLCDTQGHSRGGGGRLGGRDSLRVLLDLRPLEDMGDTFCPCSPPQSLWLCPPCQWPWQHCRTPNQLGVVVAEPGVPAPWLPADQVHKSGRSHRAWAGAPCSDQSLGGWGGRAAVQLTSGSGDISLSLILCPPTTPSQKMWVVRGRPGSRLGGQGTSGARTKAHRQGRLRSPASVQSHESTSAGRCSQMPPPPCRSLSRADGCQGPTSAPPLAQSLRAQPGPVRQAHGVRELQAAGGASGTWLRGKHFTCHCRAGMVSPAQTPARPPPPEMLPAGCFAGLRRSSRPPPWGADAVGRPLTQIRAS